MLRASALLLFALLALSPVALTAQTPIPAPLRIITLGANDLNWYTITFQYANPGDVLKLAGWGSSNQALPQGVERVIVTPGSDFLVIQATNDGFNQFNTIIDKMLAIRPDQLRLKVLLADVRTGQKVDIDYLHPNDFLEQLRDADATFSYFKQTLVDNGDSTSFVLDRFAATYHDVKGSTIKMSPILDVTPSTSTNNSVLIDFSILWPGGSRSQTMLPPNYYSMGIFPIKGTLVYEVTDQLPSAGHRIFLFITPTVLKPSVNNRQAITLAP